MCWNKEEDWDNSRSKAGKQILWSQLIEQSTVWEALLSLSTWLESMKLVL